MDAPTIEELPPPADRAFSPAQAAREPLVRFYWPSLVVLSVAVAVLSFVWGREQFAGIDYSINMNAAWQMVNGRVPYHDFLTGLPLTILAALRLAYSIAPTFQSLLVVNALLVFATCIALAALASSRFERPHLAAYAGIATIAALHLPIGILWHNQMTISIVLVTFACTAVVLDKPTSRWLWAAPPLWVLCAFSKPNLGAPAAILSFVFVAFSLAKAKRRRDFALSVAYAFVLTIGLLWFMGVDPLELVHNFQDASERLSSNLYTNILQESDAGITYPLAYYYGAIAVVGLALAAAGCAWRSRRARVVEGLRRSDFSSPSDPPTRPWSITSLLLGTGFTAILVYGLYLDNDLKTNEVVAALFVLWWMLRAETRVLTRPAMQVGLVSSITLITIVATFWPRSTMTTPVVMGIIAVGLTGASIDAWTRGRSRTSPDDLLENAGTWLVRVGVIFLAILVLQVSVDRGRARAAGDGTFFERTELTGFSPRSTLHGTLTGPRLHRVKTALDSLAGQPCVAKLVPRGDIFVGPRIDFAYGEEDWLPPTGLPLWWEAYGSGAKNQNYDPSERFGEVRPSLAVFLKNDYTFLPASVVDFVNAEYHQVPSDELDIFVSPRVATCLGV